MSGEPLLEAKGSLADSLAFSLEADLKAPI
jgi:hypothetical protein